jgi:2-polyprenyl-3-methyl-5-hydroxy-6-metoxy-1,4-benzoquinol methylase
MFTDKGPSEFRAILTDRGFYSVEPLPTPEFLAAYYAEQYFQHPDSQTYSHSYSQQELTHRRLKGQALVRSLQQQCAPLTLLDCGAGEGFLLAAAVEAGINAFGIDYSAFGVNSWHPHLSGRLHAGNIEESIRSMEHEGRTFDACTLVNVLEHVPDPEETLATIRPIIAKGGVIAITVPNDYSALQQLLLNENFIGGQYWFSPPQHLGYWNTESLPKFLARAGFTVLDAFTDFPIELFLLHPGSNYTTNRENNGPAAHTARMHFDLLIAQGGLDCYLDYYRALFQVGQGRNITVLARPSR